MPASTAAPAGLRLRYQGWSGCLLEAPRGASATALAIDPSPGVELEPTALTLLLTHGHFEHFKGALAHLRRADREPATVVASRPLCRYLEQRTAGRQDSFVPVDAGAQVEAGGWDVRVFGWEHMPLLPPGAGPAVRYVLKLISHPRGLFKMALGEASSPRHKPMLGFCVRPLGSAGWLVYYGEGMHRHTSRAQLRAALGSEPVDALVFGVEPEDALALPELLAGQAVKTMLAFEPHRAWRSEFCLPQVDLSQFAATLRARGLDARPLAVGETLRLP